ncbi:MULTISPECIES: alpha/beta hydrolase [unclassified Microbacterium]|uniref:alpha/beta fold hydrolase n=1 Tax=unclassified Microbacterium TaxID=2609290 RepID=UPI00214C05C6|nr:MULTISPECIES: alpha/beta hydrolase [unclassified Microbacterium]MCR2810639.1 alpha/beta hydrolase [Microbacterium sp. zg.B185]WIM18176.1 alpha/beta hydrolase [Microbacterium sp. zg-B185]
MTQTGSQRPLAGDRAVDTRRMLAVEGPAGHLAGWIQDGTDESAVPLLFLHPINTRGAIWFDVVDLLPADRTYLMPDLRAHGDSAPCGDFGLDEWLSDIEAVIDSHGEGPLHVVGGSLGGSLAVCLAARRPQQVVSITGLGSSLNFDGADAVAVIDLFDRYGIPGTFEKVFPEITFGPYADRALIDHGIRLSNPNDVETVKRVWSATVFSDSTDRAADVACPALVVTGEFDGTCTPALGLEMARRLKTTQILLPDIGHMPMLEDPRRVVDLLTPHFAQAEALFADATLSALPHVPPNETGRTDDR